MIVLKSSAAHGEQYPAAMGADRFLVRRVHVDRKREIVAYGNLESKIRRCERVRWEEESAMASGTQLLAYRILD
jgi:hypothetical protein